MLTLKEARWSLKTFQIFSILNILPIEVDVKSGKIQRQSNKIKVFMWKILFCVGVSHWLYIFGRLVQSTVIEPEKYFRWDHFVLHFGTTSFYAVFYCTAFILFVKKGEETVIIFNQLFTEREDPVQKMLDEEQQQQLEIQMRNKSKKGDGNENQGTTTRGKSGTQLLKPSARESRDRQEENQDRNPINVVEEPSKFKFKFNSEIQVSPRPLLTWPPQYSLDELIAKLFPLVLLPSEMMGLLFLARDPSRPQFLYSALPPEGQSVFSFLSLSAIEGLFMTILAYAGAFSTVTQILFFSKCQREFKQKSLQLKNLREKFQNRPLGNRDVKTEIWILRQILKEVKELLVLIELFNRCFPFCIFAWKNCGLSCCILFYFFVIRHHEDFLFLSVFLGYCASVMTLLYTIMYKQAFSIPGKIDELKNEFLLTAQKTTTTKVPTANVHGNGNKNLLAEMKREIKRIRGVGIKVGGFHQMERESTPNFVNFVFNQVVSLLVQFPG